ncbi:MAG: His/Gly/Thr/Pro-type tRNA ligase C-terminal domain-containing protein, partial [Limisphaerales bacterium]
DYYTGPIFETVLRPVEIGSLTGGGRYDNLIGSFTGKNVPATGTSFGLERIIDILMAKDKGEIGSLLARTQILVIPFSPDSVPYALEVATFLRSEKIRTTVYPFPSDKMKDKFTWTSQRKNRFVAVVGPDEMTKRKVTFKNMTTGQQVKLSFGELPPDLADDLL